VQLEGVAEKAVGEELLRVQAAYFAVWCDGPVRMNWSAIAYIVVRTRWLRYSDSDQGPPLIWKTKLKSSIDGIALFEHDKGIH